MTAKVKSPKAKRKVNPDAAPRSTIALHPADRDRLKELMDASNFKGSQADFLTVLLDNYSGSSMFNTEDSKKIDDAANIANMPKESLIVTGALKFADLLLANYASQQDETVTEEKRKPADLKVHQEVEAIMKHNEEAADHWDKIEITQGVLFKRTGCNRANIQRYLSANKNRIEKHHAKMKIEPDHNRRAANIHKGGK
jgi:hypothetical protein